MTVQSSPTAAVLSVTGAKVNEKTYSCVTQWLQSAVLLVLSSPVLAAESGCTQSQESAGLIPAPPSSTPRNPQPLLFLFRGGSEGR